MNCTHPPCDCLVVVGERFCSPSCENQSPTDLLCGCPHPDCSGADDGIGGVLDDVPPQTTA